MWPRKWRKGWVVGFLLRNIRLRKQASKREAGKRVTRELYQELLTAGYCEAWIVIRNLWEMLPPAADLTASGHLLHLDRRTGRVFYQNQRFSFHLNFLDSLINFPGGSCWFLTHFNISGKRFVQRTEGLLWHQQVPPALLQYVQRHLLTALIFSSIFW